MCIRDRVVAEVHERRLARAREHGTAVLEAAVMAEDDVQDRLRGMRAEAVDVVDQPPHAVVPQRDLALQPAGVGHLDRAAVEGIGVELADVVQERAGIEMTDAGKLQGEIPLGYYRVRRVIDAIDGFDSRTAEAVLHIILSHHGSLEHGSPIVPCTREATLVHFCDNLGGRLGSFDRLEKELASGERWSRFDRAIGGGAYFAAAAQDARQAA